MVGGGHMMRCLALARALPESSDIKFVLDEGGEDWIERVLKYGFSATTENRWRLENCHGSIIDGYEFDESIYKNLRRLCNVLAIIDDRRNIPDMCDLAILPTVYENVDQKGCRVLQGSRFTLLEPEYLNPKDIDSIGPVRKILVCCGMIDSPNCSLEILNALEDSDLSGEITVLLSSRAPHLNGLKEKARTHRLPVFFAIDTSGSYNLIFNSDFIIGGGGQGLSERLAIGCPSITITLADNQREQVNWISRKGGTVAVERKKEKFSVDLTKLINETIQSPSSLKEMSKSGRRLVDGRGAGRVAEVLANM